MFHKPGTSLNWVPNVYIKRKLNSLLKADDAATSVEYAIMLMLIIGAAIAAIQVLGGESGALWGTNDTEIENSITGAVDSLN